MPPTWDPSLPGLVQLPRSGTVRVRSYRTPLAPGAEPDFSLFVSSTRAPEVPWDVMVLERLRYDTPDARKAVDAALDQVRRMAPTRRVEIAARGARKHVATVVACLTILDGYELKSAIQFTRQRFGSHALIAPYEREFLASFTQRLADRDAPGRSS